MSILLLPAVLKGARSNPKNTIQLTPEELRYYETARPVTTWSPRQLLHADLGLKGLKFADSQADLPAILAKTGETVQALFRDFTNTESVETIAETRINPVTGQTGFGPSVEQKFHYLFLTTADAASAGLDEYRTDSKGQPVEADHLLPGAAFMTEGFASLPALFLPERQPESTFRYLGEQKMNKQQTLVVAFAQRPRAARTVGTFNSGRESVVLLIQGIAWIALPEDQIVRMRTDLLAPRADIGLEQETTDIRFKDVRFKQNHSALWLPVDVVVTIGWQGSVFQNHHHYTDFKLFQVTTANQAAKQTKRRKKP